VGKGRGVLGTCVVEIALEELNDLLKRERLSLVAGGDRVALDWR
jgi:hypothetical protein